MPVYLERTYQFAASHHYWRPDWAEEKNRRVFGKCAQGPGHGHNYRVTVTVTGDLDPETGFCIDLPELDRLVKVRILDRLDHRHLNDAVAEFTPGKKVPTSENLATWIASQIQPALPTGASLTEVRVAEDDMLAAIWRTPS